MSPAEPRILLVYAHPDLPSSRVRVVQMAPCLSAAGLPAECAAYPSSVREKRDLWRRRYEFDLVILQTKMLSRFEARFWRLLGIPVIFDFDDALPFRHSPKRGSVYSRTRQRRFRRTLDAAVAVVVGNATLAGLASPAGKRIHVAPSPVPFPVPLASAGGSNQEFRVGWVGSGGNLDSLVLISQALRRVARQVPLTLVVIADRRLELEGVHVEFRRWSLEDQEQDLASLDVGVMPLADTPWNRGKCAYKLLQYMAAAVPGVASPVGMNAEVLHDRLNGRLARTDEEWVEALLELQRDPDLRRRLGEAGRRTVEEGYTYHRVAGDLATFLRSVFAELPSRPR